MQALVGRGHDVTRTPNEWMRLDASDEEQLLGASEQGRCIFTFNARDFLPLSQLYPDHRGIILAAQSRWKLSGLIAALDHLLTTAKTEDVIRQVLWLPRVH